MGDVFSLFVFLIFFFSFLCWFSWLLKANGGGGKGDYYERRGCVVVTMRLRGRLALARFCQLRMWLMLFMVRGLFVGFI